MSVIATIVQTKDWIIDQIQNGTFKENEPLPSEYEIAKLVDVSTDDVQAALHELVTEQIITERFQEGYFPKQDPIFYYPVNELISITEMIEQEGFQPGTIIISYDPETPSTDDKQVLKIDDDSKITVIERIRTADGEPVVYSLDKIKKEHVKIDPAEDNLSLFKLFSEDKSLTITRATCEIEAMSYEPYISNALECAPEDSLLIFKQVHYNESNDPVLYSLLYFKSSQIKFQINREMK